MVNPYNPLQPPKLSETRQATQTDRASAWACVVSNLVLPGLGTFVARRRLAGVLQLVISQIGFVFMLLWAISYALSWIRQGSPPEDTGPNFRWGVLGMMLFLLAWIWSLASSIAIVHDSRNGSL